eukprot:196522-Prymnesium_polylepis.1
MSTSAAPDTPSTPASYDAGCAAAAFGLAATLLLHSRANQALRSRSFSAKRLLYSMILRLAPAVAIVNFIACTAPGLHKGAALAQHTLVALVMACFMELLLLLLFRISLCKSGEEEAQAPGISNVLEHFEASFSKFERQFEPSEYIDGVVRVMRQQPNIAYFASPPIGCCFALCPFLPCGRPQPPTAMLVATLRRAVLVCAAGAVLVPLFALWVDHVPAMAAHREAIQQLAHGLELGVTLLALYSLFITYRLSKARTRSLPNKHPPSHAGTQRVAALMQRDSPRCRIPRSHAPLRSGPAQSLQHDAQVRVGQDSCVRHAIAAHAPRALFWCY